MKILKILSENETRFKVGYVKAIKALENLNVDSKDRVEIYNTLKNVLHIENRDTLTDLVYLFNEYGYDIDVTPNEEIEDFLKSINVVDLEIDIFGEHIMALSTFLDTNPINIEPHFELYNLVVYKDTETGFTYAIGTDDEVNEAIYRERLGYIEDEGYYGIKLDFLKNFIEVDSYALDEEANHLTENYIDNMTTEEKINHLGLEEEFSSFYLKLEKIEEEMDEIYNKLDLLEKNDSDYEEKNDLLRGKLNILKNEKSEINEEIEDSIPQDRLYDLVYENEREMLEDKGIDYFIELGYGTDDLVRMFSINDRKLVKELSEEIIEYGDRGNVLNYNNGEEEEIRFNNQYFFIYNLGND